MATIVKSRLIHFPHGFSTRIGGISTGIYESLNLGMNVGDNAMHVKRNWQIFLSECGIDTWDFVCGKQVHGNNVHIATMEDAKPAYKQDPLIEADGYVTNQPGLPLAIFTADCVPVLLTDEVNGVCGAVHCGWRSTVADIEKNAVEKMISLGASPGNIRAAIGPSIGRCCFEVGGEVIDAAMDLVGKNRTDLYSKGSSEGKYMLDLQGVVKARLIMLGLVPSYIETIYECTKCNPNKYWSHRVYALGRGSMASAVMIPR